MKKIYNKETNTFDFGKIVINPNLTYDEIILKYNNLISKKLDSSEHLKCVVIKQFKLDDYYYYVTLMFNSKNIIDRFTIQINNKKIVLPKSWEDYDDDEEKKKICIEKTWLISENVKNNEKLCAVVSVGRDDGIARIVILYKIKL